MADTDYDTYKSDRKDRSLASLVVAAADAERSVQEEIRTGFGEGRIVAAAQNFARSLVNEPGNVLTPTVLGERAKAMCEEAGLAVRGALDGEDPGTEDGRVLGGGAGV